METTNHADALRQVVQLDLDSSGSVVFAALVVSDRGWNGQRSYF
jgi:hypothetical protein